jgi:hypothetical protein
MTPKGGAHKTGYSPVNALKLNYDIHGSGEPPIQLNGV